MTLLAIAGIAYGSLYPFHLRFRPGDPFSALLATWDQYGGRGDVIANVLLYLPFGFFASGSLPNVSSARRVLLAALSGGALSLGMELAQFYDAGRQSAMSDVYSNVGGTLVGATLALVAGGQLAMRGTTLLRRQPHLMLLLASWLAYRLYPYVPVIDLHKYWHAVQPLIRAGTIPLEDWYRHTAIWLAISVLIQELVGAAWDRVAVWAVLAFVTSARVLILGIVLSPAEVAGGVLAAALWSIVLARRSCRVRVILGLLAGAILVQGLAPFHFVSTAHSIVWFPFAGFLGGSIELNVLAFFEKTFLYGTLVWLGVRAGLRWSAAAATGCLLVIAVRLAQTYIPERSAEMTDAILLLLIAATMKALSELSAVATKDSRVASVGWIERSALAVYDSLTLNDVVQPVDLILVLAGRLARKAHGLQLYQTGIAPRLLLSVGRFEVSKMRGLGLSEYEALIAVRDATPAGNRHFFVMLDSGGTRIELARVPRWSTYGEAMGLRLFLQQGIVGRIMIVSTAIHLRRVALSFNKLFRGAEVQFLYCAVPETIEPLHREGWWRRWPDFRYVITELVKFAGYRMILSFPVRIANALMRVNGR